MSVHDRLDLRDRVGLFPLGCLSNLALKFSELRL
jgi:hypothetical protein